MPFQRAFSWKRTPMSANIGSTNAAGPCPTQISYALSPWPGRDIASVSLAEYAFEKLARGGDPSPSPHFDRPLLTSRSRRRKGQASRQHCLVRQHPVLTLIAARHAKPGGGTGDCCASTSRQETATAAGMGSPSHKRRECQEGFTGPVSPSPPSTAVRRQLLADTVEKLGK